VKLDFGKILWIYLKPGDSLDVEIDAAKETESITVTGDSLEINRFLVQDSHESARASEYFSHNFREIVLLDEEGFRQKINEIWSPFAERFDSFIQEKKIRDQDFMKFHRAAMRYSRTDILLQYEGWHRNLSGDPEFRPSESFYDFLEELEYNDPSLLRIEEYRGFLERYLDYRQERELDDTSRYEGMSFKPVRARIRVCLDTFTDPQIRSEMLYSLMHPIVSEHNHKGLEDLIRIFRDNCTNQDYVQDIEKLIAADKAIRDNCRIMTYKTTGNMDLDALVYLPEGHQQGDQRTAVAFFHGGGWDVGKPEWGQMQCEHFSSLGLVAVSFEYRLWTRHGASPVEGVADAKSALRWMRKNSNELGIDPERIVASGFSAGGHLALCTVMIHRFDEPGEDLSVSAAPNAMLLWVTPAKIFGDMWFRRILRDDVAVEDLDPDSHIKPGLPPSVMFQGTIDSDVPPWSVKAFAGKMRAAGNRCDLHVYEGQTHLNWGENSLDVLEKMDAFLKSIGFLDQRSH
jgi:acetyl esterase/lipase